MNEKLIGFIDFSNRIELSLTEINTIEFDSWAHIKGYSKTKWGSSIVLIDNVEVKLNYWGILDVTSDPVQVSVFIPLKKGQTIKAQECIRSIELYNMLR